MDEFMKLVQKMRKAQKDYYSYKNRDDHKSELLKESKKLEREVDQRIKSIEEPGLF